MSVYEQCQEKQPERSCLRKRLVVYLLVLSFLLVGQAFRMYGLDWDQGYGLHPDERYIARIAASIRLPDDLSDLFASGETTLSPYIWPAAASSAEQFAGDDLQIRSRQFSYGHLPLYLLVLVGGGDSDEARITLIGRVLSAIFDVITIALTFALARVLCNTSVGLLGSAFLAFTVMHIQLAHYATFDAALTCFAIVTLLFATRFARFGRRWDAIFAGICFGFAAGTKISAVLLAVPLAMAFALRCHVYSRCYRRSLFLLFALCLFIGFLVFCLTNPFAIIRFSEFISNLRSQAAMLNGDDSFPFTIQYRGTIAFLYPIVQQVRWGMGIPLGIIALAGLAHGFVGLGRGSVPTEMWIPIGWIFIYFGLFGSLPVKFMRYMLPVLPVMVMLGAATLLTFFESVRKGKRQIVASGGIVLIGVLTLFYSLAFLAVYRNEHPWLRLSRWIYANVPVNQTIASEQWDHNLPLTIQQAGVVQWPGQYQQQVLDLYVPDDSIKLFRLIEQLEVSDYLIIASNRIYGSVTRWPERFPLMRRYYELLFSGGLGYQPVSMPNIERHPSLGPFILITDPMEAVGLPSPLAGERGRNGNVTLRLGPADESFTVYDHPRPLLLKNVEHLSGDEMANRFSSFAQNDLGY